MQPLAIGDFDKKPLAKHHGLAAVQKHTMLGMPFHRTSQRGAFKIAASNRQSLGAHRVIYAGDVLFNDRAFVEIGRHVMRCAPISLTPRSCA